MQKATGIIIAVVFAVVALRVIHEAWIAPFLRHLHARRVVRRALMVVRFY